MGNDCHVTVTEAKSEQLLVCLKNQGLNLLFDLPRKASIVLETPNGPILSLIS